MKKPTKSYEIDMVNGPLLGKILLFAVPLMLSSILQLLFNAADIIVVGQYAGKQALAAVGSTTAFINLLINLFIGLSVGANATVARYAGEKKDDDVNRTVHTAIAMSLISGAILCVVGVVCTRIIMELMGSPADVIDQSVLYLRIYFLGMPALMLYNFGSAVLRAIGDTKRPLYYLLIAGIVNVVFNLFFVIVCNLSVAGVALATILSEIISAFFVIRCLMRTEGACHLDLKRLKIYREKLKLIINIGIPAGLQGVLFSLSNVMIQASVNSFGSVVMAGNTAAANIEGFVYAAMNAFQQTVMSFTSQNYGARQEERIKKIAVLCVVLVSITGLALGWSAYLLGTQLLKIYSPDPAVIKIGLLRMGIICTMYFLCGIMDTMVGALRGLGIAVMPMIVSLIGACGLRIIWLYTIFEWNHTLFTLYLSYPITWLITASVHVICYIGVYKKLFKKKQALPEL